MYKQRRYPGYTSMEGCVIIRSTKRDAPPSFYIYPMNPEQFQRYWTEKEEAASYFKGVFVSVVLQRLAPAFQQMDFAAADTEKQKWAVLMAAEAVSRTFPSRQVYDKCVRPASDAMEKGGKTADGETYTARQWEKMNTGEIWSQISQSISKLDEMFQGGQYTIMSPELYPICADALIWARILYTKLDTTAEYGGDTPEGNLSTGDAELPEPEEEEVPEEEEQAVSGAEKPNPFAKKPKKTPEEALKEAGKKMHALMMDVQHVDIERK
jgi:hypothetical protein